MSNAFDRYHELGHRYFNYASPASVGKAVSFNFPQKNMNNIMNTITHVKNNGLSSISFIFLLITTFLCASSLVYPVTAESQGILQRNLVPFSISGSTQLSDGAILVLRLEYGINASQIWKSVDHGETWTYVSTLPWSGRSGIEKMFCTDKDTVLVADGGMGYQGYIHRSTDRGATWTISHTFDGPYEGSPFNIFEDNNGSIFVPVYSSGSTINHAKLLKSVDDGVSWQQMAFWPGYRHCHSMFVNKHNGYIYVILGDSPPGLMRSKDGGQTWTNLYTSELFTSINGRGDSNAIFLGTDSGNKTRIYRLDDDGSDKVRMRPVYDYGSNQSGHVYYMVIANGRLVFGTVGSSISQSDTGYHCVLGVSDFNWTKFSIVADFVADKPYAGFKAFTYSYWNISKLFIKVSPGLGWAFEPTAAPSTSPLPISNMPNLNPTPLPTPTTEPTSPPIPTPMSTAIPTPMPTPTSSPTTISIPTPALTSIPTQTLSPQPRNVTATIFSSDYFYVGVIVAVASSIAVTLFALKKRKNKQ